MLFYVVNIQRITTMVTRAFISPLAVRMSVLILSGSGYSDNHVVHVTESEFIGHKIIMK